MSDPHAEIAALQGLVERKNQSISTLNQLVNDKAELFEDFKRKVRAAAIATQKGHAGHISVESLNDWLTELDLEPVTINWAVTVLWNGIALSSATVRADSAEDAENECLAALGAAIELGRLGVHATLQGDVRDTAAVTWDHNGIRVDADDPDDVESPDLDVFDIQVTPA